MEITFEEIEECGRQLYNNFKSSLRAQIAADKNYAEEAAEAVCSTMVDELLTEVVGDVHRAAKLGYIDLFYSRIYDRSLDDQDIPFIPQNEDSKTKDINCPKCDKLIRASGFATHLQKCMDMEFVQTPRKASQKIGNTSVMGSGEADKSKAEKSRSGKKKKDDTRRMQDAHKQTKRVLFKNQGDTGNSSKEQTSDARVSPNKVATVVNEGKLTAMLSRCNVKSDRTGKHCSKSLRCPVHSDAERAVARKLLIGENVDIYAEEAACPKSVAGGISQLKLTSSPISKKREKPKSGEQSPHMKQ